jgi:hypothetical protein
MARSCSDCREFWIDERSGEIKKGPTGEPLRRQHPVDCSACPKRGWERFTPLERTALECYEACRAFRQLPWPGGVGDQHPETMETMMALDEVRNRADEELAEARENRRMARMRKELGLG